MTAGQAAVLGAVQGVAEVVPVSSSAQLALLPRLLGWPEPPHRTAFAAALHLGSTLGIAVALRRELADLARTPAGRRRAVLLLATCVPAAAAGLLVDDVVEQRLGRPGQVAALLAGAGALMWAADTRPQHRADVGPAQALAASLAQLLALAPGVSRGGATLTALRLCRVEQAAAARFSLLMSLPVTGGAALLPLARSGPEVRSRLAPLLVTGGPAAAAAGAASAAAWRRRPARPATAAAVYRLGVAAAVAGRSARRRPRRSRPG
jgi:undecaprenyl-diphosphatase